MVAGVQPPENEPERLTDFRRILAKEAATAKENGWVAEIPAEFDSGV